MKTNKQLRVYCEGCPVGLLALTAEKQIAFEYDECWLDEGFSISPFSLPLKRGVYISLKRYFQGLFGVFADSLPDAWGNVLLNKVLRNNGIRPEELNILDRLAIVGKSGMGALVYEPEYKLPEEEIILDLDRMAEECRRVLEFESDAETLQDLDMLYRLGGTSGGARPKIMTKLDGRDWIIKFPAHADMPDSGKMEYDYSLCAKACKIPMMDTKLFPSKSCSGYFGTIRFDRKQLPDGTVQRIHMLSAAALLEIDFEQPSLDYHSLMKLTKILTKNNAQDVENMFRIACFNIFAHNRDDHAKNFTYLYQPEADAWQLSPAYDLTCSTTYYGEHTTSADGNGRNPGAKELLAVGTAAGISRAKCRHIIDEIQGIVTEQLGKYLCFTTF